METSQTIDARLLVPRWTVCQSPGELSWIVPKPFWRTAGWLSHPILDVIMTRLIVSCKLTPRDQSSQNRRKKHTRTVDKDKCALGRTIWFGLVVNFAEEKSYRKSIQIFCSLASSGDQFFLSNRICPAVFFDYAACYSFNDNDQESLANSRVVISNRPVLKQSLDHWAKHAGTARTVG